MTNTNETRNEFGAPLFITALRNYAKGETALKLALIDAAKGYGDMHDDIIRANNGEVPQGKGMAKALADRLSEAGKSTKTAGEWLADRKQRSALLWMRDHPAQVEFLQQGDVEYTTPRSLEAAWTRHFRATVTDAIREEGGDKPDAGDMTAIQTLPGVSRDDIEAEYTRLDIAAAAKAKRDAEEAERSAKAIEEAIAARGGEAQPQPQPQPSDAADLINGTPAMDHSALNAAQNRVLELEAEVRMLQAQLAEAGKAKPKPKAKAKPAPKAKAASKMDALMDEAMGD